MDPIDRQAAIDALWKALYKYEDEIGKQFQESGELDVWDWIGHRIFVQNMNDIDRKTIMDLPSAQPEIIHCGECVHLAKEDDGEMWCGIVDVFGLDENSFCSFAERRTDAAK